ncbi:hypothetical protein FACS189454_01060 [Planctomycetales bacterium]|nr:hypothetical protein FACS189454_01060 [Planctomycetales bacterium]
MSTTNQFQYALAQVPTSPDFYSSAPDWQTDFDAYIVTNGSVLNYLDQVPALHFHGRWSDSTADNITFTASGLTVSAGRSNVFDFHGNPNLWELWNNSDPERMLEIGGVAVTNSKFTFSDSVFYLNGSSIGMIYSMTSSEANIENVQFNFTGSDNAALVLPQFTGDNGRNTINVDADSTFNLGNGGSNTAIAIGADNTLLNFGGTLTLRGSSDRGLYLSGQNIVVDGTSGLTINVNGAASEGITNNGSSTITGATITTTASGTIGIKNGFDNSIHLVEGPELVFEIQYYDDVMGAWVAFTDDTPDLPVGQGIRYRIAIAPEEEGGAYRQWGSGHWTTAQLGDGYAIGEDSIKLSENAWEQEVPELPDGAEGGFFHYDPYTGENLLNADAVLVVDSTIINAADIAIENHGTVTVQNGSKITAGTIGILSEYVQGVTQQRDPDVDFYAPYYNYYNNNITVDNSVITGTGSTAIKTQVHQFYRNVEPDDDPLTPPSGPEDGYYVSFFRLGWQGGYYDNLDFTYYDRSASERIDFIDDIYNAMGRKISIINGSQLGQKSENEPGGVTGGVRVGTGIDFSGDWHDIYIDSTSQINATQFGIRSTSVPMYGWHLLEHPHHIGNYAGTMNRIAIQGQVVGGVPFAQTPIAGIDPLTHKPLGYDFSNPSTPDYQKYITTVIDPVSGESRMIPTIDPATLPGGPNYNPAYPNGRPYRDERYGSGAQVVTIRDSAASGTGVYVTGDSLGWDIQGDPEDGAWSGYFGPVVSEINVVGQGALLQGGHAAIEIGDFGYDNATHVGKIQSGRNDEIARLTATLSQSSNKSTNQANYNAFNDLTVGERDYALTRIDDSGIKGDIISWYNGVAGWADVYRNIRVSNATSLDEGNSNSFEGQADYRETYYGGGFAWGHQYHAGELVWYFDTIGGRTVSEADFRSKLLGHRDYFPNDAAGELGDWWTIAPQGSPAGRSVILDEILLQWGFATFERPAVDAEAGEGAGAEGGATPNPSVPITPAVLAGLHYREAFDKMLADTSLAANLDTGLEMLTGLTRAALLEGLTRDGTLLKFGDDIYSGTILGGGFGVTYAIGSELDREGNIDVQFTSLIEGQKQTTIFNHNTAYVRSANIRSDGHLMLNDATLIVDRYEDVVDITRLMIHDVWNDGKVSGNGLFELSQRSYKEGEQPNFEDRQTKSMYAGIFVNAGTLAPGLSGYIGTNYDNATLVDGGQLGDMKFHGSVRFEKAGTLELTLADYSIGDLFEYYGQTAPPTDWRTDIVDPAKRQMFWDTLRQEKTATRAAWVDSATDRIPEALRTRAGALQAEITSLQKVMNSITTENPQYFTIQSDLNDAQEELAATQAELTRRTQTLRELSILLPRYGMSDVLDVSGKTALSDELGENISFGGTLKIEQIWNPNSDNKLAYNSYVVAASDRVDKDDYGFYKMPNAFDSDTLDVVFANVSVNPNRFATGQYPVVLSVVDDANYYQNRIGGPYNSNEVARALDDAMLTNPGLAQSLSFDLNSPDVLRDVTRQMAASSRANSVMMNLWSPTNTVFNQIGYGHGGLSTGNRGNVVYRNQRDGKLFQPYGQPAVAPQGTRYAAPQGQIRGQAPSYRNGSAWGNYLHSTFSMDDDDNSFKYTYSRNGVIVGTEWNLTPSTVWGYTGWASYGKMRERWDETKSNDYGLGVYFVAAPYEQFELKTFLGLGFQQYTNDRYIRNDEVFISYQKDRVLGIDEHYGSETDGYSANFSLELARPFTMSPNFVIRPAVGFEIQSMTQNGYSENPDNSVLWTNTAYNIVNHVQGPVEGNYGLDFQKLRFSRSLVRFGVNTESYFAGGRGGWQARAYYTSRLTGDKVAASTQTFQSGGSVPFQTRGGYLGSSSVQFGLGTHLWLNRARTATFFANGDGDFSLSKNTGYSLFNFSLGLMQNF